MLRTLALGALLACAALRAAAQAPADEQPATTATSPVQPASTAPPSTPAGASARLQSALDCARARGARPLVGLALSGGGARGLAHIGVLAGLEAMGIPVDRVSGTSMGAVVGGLYAAGYSASEIDRIARSLDWQLLFGDSPSWQSLSPLQKERHGRTLFEFDFENWRPRAGGGLIAGQRLTTLFATLTLPVSDRQRFVELPVPFACVATDVATGGEVVLDSGSLPEAMRASMAIPLVFTPVERDGRRLIDGGLSNNLPVEQARALGAELVIAVDVSAPLLPAERLGSMLSIAQQLMAYQTVASRNLQAPQADVLLKPDLGPHDAADFGEAADLIERGRRAVEAEAATLRALAEVCRLPAPPGAAEAPGSPADEFSVGAGAAGGEPSTPAPVEAAVGEAPEEGPGGAPLRGPAIDRVVIEGGGRLRPRVLERWARVPLGRPLQAAALAQQIDAIFATGYFESIHPQVEPLPEGGHLLRLRLEERRAVRLGLGLRYEDERGPAMLLTLGRINLLGRDNGLHVDARLGTVSRLDLHYLQPSYPATSFFLSLRLSGVDDFRFVYGPERERDRYIDRRAVLDLAGGNTLRALGEVSLAYRLEQVNFHAEEDPEDGLVGSEIARLGMLSLRSRVDTLDRDSFPTRGRRVAFAADAARQGLASQSRFNRARLSYDGYRPLGAGTLHLGARLGTSFGDALPESEKLLLGGPDTLHGLNRAERRGDELAALRVGWRVPLGTLPPIGGGRYYLGGSLDFGSVAPERRDLERGAAFGVGLEFAVDSRVGPLRVIGGWAEGGIETVYFNLGFPF